ncbi:uncharacterized protein LOC111478319 isoform X2 [Cucurbita maxima]|uniref:Uncharacterized protein LOC111478319 isoform X2 n=1 Tax=Cucurbita maxima TaxID=3661 RepID=A0A6J1ISL5_CUCMA|nr:uncharacterized protein LOC111478319 isoform X2 [Cucurbita maxima]XP_022978288.1 uncharacterized protein LOC111478319 isoform X2 [Cucurbita maxima]XP_022978289.1 uncharacterized protein LOC111478319 isoform X2 [Cucurbita maxima]
MSVSEITEEEEEVSKFIDPEVQRERIRQILKYQKSVYSSSSSSSSSISTSASSSRSCSLLDLMKAGNASLRRLFDMQHTSLATYFDKYSGSPTIKPIPLWGSDSDVEICDAWASIKIGPSHDSRSLGTNCTSNGVFMDRNTGLRNSTVRVNKHKLTRKKSFRKLPGFGLLWRSGRFRVRIRWRGLRIMICGPSSG